MARQFQENGVSFQYPESWRLEREENETGWAVLLQSPDTAFALISFDNSLPTTEETAEAALDALRADYPTLEAEERIDTLAGQMAVGYDIRFFSFDLTNTAWTRSIYCASGTLLVLCQANDLELEQHEPVLRAICASLKVEDE
jgi:hypothetical protein